MATMKAIGIETPHEELFGFQLRIIDIIGREKIVHKTVLDIGSGFGWFEKQAVTYRVKHITGVEYDPPAVAIASQLKHKKITFLHGSGLDVPCKNSSFDTVVSWEVLEHIPQHTEPIFMKEVFRVLKPGGYFCFSTQHANPLSTLLDPAWWLAGHRHYRVWSLVDFVLSAGFHIERCMLRGGIYTAIHPINLYIAKWIFRREMFFKRYMHQQLKEEFSSDTGFTNAILVCRKPKL